MTVKTIQTFPLKLQYYVAQDRQEGTFFAGPCISFVTNPLDALLTDTKKELRVALVHTGLQVCDFEFRKIRIMYKFIEA